MSLRTAQPGPAEGLEGLKTLGKTAPVSCL